MHVTEFTVGSYNATIENHLIIRIWRVIYFDMRKRMSTVRISFKWLGDYGGQSAERIGSIS